MLTEKSFIKLRGLTLLETVIALAIGALVLIGAVLYYTSTSQTANVNKAVSDMNSIVAAFKVYAAGNTVTADTNLTTLQNNNLLPNPLVNPWGGAYDVAVIPATSTVPTIIGITIVNLRGPDDDKDCAAIGDAVRSSAYYIQGSYCQFQYLL